MLSERAFLWYNIFTMITLERITKLNLQEKLEEVSKLYEIRRAFFANFYTMHVFLNLNGPELYLISNENEKYISIYKSNKKEYRFLFKIPSEHFINEFMEQEKPRYLASNMLTVCAGKDVCSEEGELVLDVERVINLADHDFRKDYRRALKKNPEFEISEYNYKNDIADILEFLESWRYGRDEEKNNIAVVENDINFFTTFGRDVHVYGVVIRHENRVIAYSLYSSYFDQTCTGIFSKVLRGYTNLGTVMTFEKCKSMLKNGFKYAYVANFNNDFKKSLASWAGEQITVYAERIHQDESMVFRSGPEQYLKSMRM
jgi:hypothetical protein